MENLCPVSVSIIIKKLFSEQIYRKKKILQGKKINLLYFNHISREQKPSYNNVFSPRIRRLFSQTTIFFCISLPTCLIFFSVTKMTEMHGGAEGLLSPQLCENLPRKSPIQAILFNIKKTLQGNGKKTSRFTKNPRKV